MMDGAAADLAQNEDVKEFYLAFPAASARASATTSSIAAASAGWPSDTPKGAGAGRVPAPPATTPQYGTREGAIPCPSFDVLETRAPEQRERELMAALPGAIAHAMARSPAIAEQLRGVDPATIDSRGAGLPPELRKHELLERQQHSRDDAAAARRAGQGLWRLRPSAGARRCACSPRPARSMNRKARAPTTGASPRALYAAGFRAGELACQLLFLSLHAGRLHDGNRRARRGLHRLSRRHRSDRAAGARHRRPGAQRLYRHAQLP